MQIGFTVALNGGDPERKKLWLHHSSLSAFVPMSSRSIWWKGHAAFLQFCLDCEGIIRQQYWRFFRQYERCEGNFVRLTTSKKKLLEVWKWALDSTTISQCDSKLILESLFYIHYCEDIGLICTCVWNANHAANTWLAFSILFVYMDISDKMFSKVYKTKHITFQ